MLPLDLAKASDFEREEIAEYLLRHELVATELKCILRYVGGDVFHVVTASGEFYVVMSGARTAHHPADWYTREIAGSGPAHAVLRYELGLRACFRAEVERLERQAREKATIRQSVEMRLRNLRRSVEHSPTFMNVIEWLYRLGQ